MKKTKIVFAAIFLLFAVAAFVACDSSDCVNANPVFDRYLPEDNEYKIELAEHLASAREAGSTVRYFFQRCDTVGGPHFYFTVKGDSLCAVACMEVLYVGPTEQDILDKMGGGRRGALFVGLDYEVVSDSTGVRFLYRGKERMID